MNKHEKIIMFSTILNRGIGTEEDTLIFKKFSHEEIIKRLANYIFMHEHLLGKIHLETCQALNDHGVDIILTINEICKIGIQIKSFFDVTEDSFASKVKRQLTESLAHGLDKWYLLICSPLKDGKYNYSQRISHLINEFNFYKTNYHCVYSPLHMVNILKQLKKVPDDEFYQNMRCYSYEVFNPERILVAVENQSKKSKDGLLENIDIVIGKEPESCLSIGSDSGMGSSEDTKESFLNLYYKLELLTKTSREFLTAIIERAKEEHAIFIFDTVKALSYEIETYLHIDHERIRKEVDVLRKHGFADFVFIGDSVYIEVKAPDNDWHVLGVIKTFSIDKSIPLRRIIVDLDFTLLD